jgi:endonuclease/exonuclease/phosphatase family metal-dependent hydrolase
MSYNVHRCVGCDGRLSPDRIARVIARYEPDVVALQELDVGHARTKYGDQPALIADALKMHYHFHPAIEVAEERYGDAILSRHPMRLVRAGPLPTRSERPRLERRGALWAEITCEGRPVQVLTTHLGLDGRERLAQAEALAGPDWLGHPDCVPPRLLCGDLNSWPGTLPYRRLRRLLRDAQVRPGSRPRATFPTRWPTLAIDHVLHSADVVVRRTAVPRTPLTCVASDHLPLVAEVILP